MSALCPMATPAAAQAQNQLDVTIYFETGGSVVAGAATQTLDVVADALTVRPYSRVNVEGHADSAGDVAQNVRLSKLRAEAVAAYLKEKGVPSEKMNVSWVGETAPILQTDDEIREPLNRTVAVQIIWE